MSKWSYQNKSFGEMLKGFSDTPIWATTWQNQQNECIRPVWSESSLSAWRKLGSLATHWVHSEGSDQTGRMPKLIWVFAGWQSLCWFCQEAAHWSFNRWVHLSKDRLFVLWPIICPLTSFLHLVKGNGWIIFPFTNVPICQTTILLVSEHNFHMLLFYSSKNWKVSES